MSPYLLGAARERGKNWKEKTCQHQLFHCCASANDAFWCSRRIRGAVQARVWLASGLILSCAPRKQLHISWESAVHSAQVLATGITASLAEARKVALLFSSLHGSVSVSYRWNVCVCPSVCLAVICYLYCALACKPPKQHNHSQAFLVEKDLWIGIRKLTCWLRGDTANFPT